MTSLKGKTLFVTGASRGIGLAIASRAARDGANIAIAAKTSDPNPKLEGTIHSAAKEIENAGGKAGQGPGGIRTELTATSPAPLALEVLVTDDGVRNRQGDTDDPNGMGV